jgi:hypothetical protein
MRHAYVIARRELVEKRFVALAAAAFAVLPFILATIPVLRGRNGSGDVIATGAGLLAVGFTLGLALVLGGSIIGRDLSEGRMSFYFSRPVGAASIWFGKVAAAVVLIAGAFAIITLPAQIAAATAWQHSWGMNAPRLAVAVIGIAIAFFFVAHVIGSFVRSRSAWIGLDFIAFCLAAWVAYLIVGPLFEAGAIEATKALGIAIGCGVVAALVGGGAWQLERGRTDRRRNHVALSQFLWTVIGVTLVLAGAYVAWMLAARPGDLSSVKAEAQSRGPWVLVTGEARGRMDYRPAFVYNSETGAYHRLPARAAQAMFTSDGATMLVGVFDMRTNSHEVFTRPVDGDDEQSTGLTLGPHSVFTSNDDGSRIVAADNGGIVTVYDVPQKRSMVSARLPENAGYVSGMYFVTPALVRLYTVTRNAPIRTLRIFDLDVNGRALRQTGEFTRTSKYLGVTASEDGRRLIVRAVDAVYVIDGTTAAVQTTIPTAGVRGTTLLRDGGTAVTRMVGNQNTIEIRDAAGTLTRSLNIPLRNTWSLRESTEGRLVMLGQAIDRPETAPWHTYIIDAGSGAIVHHITAAPVGWRDNWGWADRDPRRGPAPLPKLYFDGRLLRWDYTTNKAEVLLPKG